WNFFQMRPIWNFFQMRPDGGDERVSDVARLGNLTIRPLAPLVVLEQHHHCLALVLVRAPQAMSTIRPDCVEDRVATRTFVDLYGDTLLTGFPMRVVAVEAVGQPILGAVMKDDGRGQFAARLDDLGVLADDLFVD